MTGGVRPFTPSQEPAAVLDARTVGRDRVLATLHDRFTAAARGATRAHTLLVGPRGSGKSHIVEVALHRFAGFPELAPRLVVVRVPEDAVGFTRVTDLVDEVLREVESPYGGRAADLVAGTTRIRDALDGRVLLLVMENFDRLTKELGVAGERDLRSWVETSGHVLLLATMPLLTPAITDRERPWFGGFAATELADLTADQGGELVAAIARERGDDRLLAYLDTPEGANRIAAVAQLTGGSPRIWTILGDCLNVDSLEALVPAVHDLLEGLVPYYQQLLWDLPGNEARIVRLLAEGERAALTVAEIAEGVDLDQRTVSTTLRRLKLSSWVREEKPETGDQRRVFYQLREPMLRHHMQYRAGRREPLLIVVQLLRAWFSRGERLRHLGGGTLGAETRRHLAASLGGQWSALASSGEADTREGLTARARSWLAGEEANTWGVRVGELVLMCLHEAAAAPGATMVTQSPERSAVTMAVGHLSAAATDRVRISTALNACADTVRGHERRALTLVSCSWDSTVDPAGAVARLDTELTAWSITDPLWTEARLMAVRCLRCSGRATEALSLAEDTLATHQRFENDRDTLSVRHALAACHADAGRLTEAIDLYQAVLTDYDRLLGPDHPHTLWARHGLASAYANAGHLAQAIDLYQAVLTDQTLLLGPDHPDTLRTRLGLANTLLDARTPGEGLELLTAALPAATRSEVAGLQGYATWVLGRYLDTAADGYLTVDATDGGLVGAFAAALSGSDEMLQRLPAELADLVREQRAAPTV